jgi:hypothetical protein
MADEGKIQMVYVTFVTDHTLVLHVHVSGQFHAPNRFILEDRFSVPIR